MRRALIADIIRHASRLSGIATPVITGPTRYRYVVRVRQAVCLIAREQMRHDGDCFIHAYSYPQIGRALGGRDHSTVIHATQTAAVVAQRDPKYASFLEQLRTSARSGDVIEMKRLPVMIPVEPRRKPPRPTIDDGYTLQERTDRDHIIAASQQLASAIMEARAA